MTITRGTTTTTETRLVAEHCYSCGVPFGLGAQFQRDRREDRRLFYCPNGHGQAYVGKNETDVAREERDAARELARREADRRRGAEAEARRADYQRRAAKGQLTKLRNRIANGVCPCCNRSFTNLRKHIAGQHPDFTLPAGIVIEGPTS